MRARGWRILVILLRLACLGLLLAAGYLTYTQWNQFKQTQAVYPAGSQAAGIPIGGLDRTQAAQRLGEAYAQPLELRYRGATILLSPAQSGFQLDLKSMLPADLADPPGLLSPAFWDYLWGRRPQPVDVALKYSFSEDKLRAFLKDEVAPRYDQSPTAARPLPASVSYQPGSPGLALDVEAALPAIEQALPTLDRQPVDLPTQSVPPLPPALKDLQTQLQQVLNVSGFDGLAGVYLFDPRTSQSIHLVYRQGASLPVEPDVAFTASSIIKIPILVAVYRRLPGTPDENVTALLHKMIAASSNEAADALMKQVLDQERGPLLVTEDMQKLGLKNTFMAGFFSLGSALLQVFQTPANQRIDANTDPDPYSQTSPADIGQLVGWIYQCAHSNSGKLIDTFPGEMTQAKCQGILDTLKLDRQAYLIKAGLPDGTQIAHKHGYGSFQGTINTIGDAGLVFTPGGDYVLVVFLNNPQLLLWEPSNVLVGSLSQAAYNYFNPPQP
ncbi:MAG TPA: serine hydrolase [Anaerolineales bacterium]